MAASDRKPYPLQQKIPAVLNRQIMHFLDDASFSKTLRTCHKLHDDAKDLIPERPIERCYQENMSQLHTIWHIPQVCGVREDLKTYNQCGLWIAILGHQTNSSKSIFPFIEDPNAFPLKAIIYKIHEFSEKKPDELLIQKKLFFFLIQELKKQPHYQELRRQFIREIISFKPYIASEILNPILQLLFNEFNDGITSEDYQVIIQGVKQAMSASDMRWMHENSRSRMEFLRGRHASLIEYAPRLNLETLALVLPKIDMRDLDDEKVSILTGAVQAGLISETQLLLENKANPNGMSVGQNLGDNPFGTHHVNNVSLSLLDCLIGIHKNVYSFQGENEAIPALLKMLITSGAQTTPDTLQRAIQFRDEKVLDCLLDAEEKKSEQLLDNLISTLDHHKLDEYSIWDRPKHLRVLLKHGANLEKLDKNGRTLLERFVEQSTFLLVSYHDHHQLNLMSLDCLLEHKANVDHPNKEESVAFHHALRLCGPHAFGVKTLAISVFIKIAAKHQWTQPQLSSLRKQIIKDRDTVLLEQLIEHKSIDVDSRNEKGQTLLAETLDTLSDKSFQWRLEDSDYQLLRLLLKFSNINVPMDGGVTPLMLAMTIREIDRCYPLFFEMKPDVNAVDEKGRTALFFLAYKHPDITETEKYDPVFARLLEAKADINHRTHGGYTALIYAAKTGGLVSNLLRLGAEDLLQNNKFETALSCSRDAFFANPHSKRHHENRKVLEKAYKKRVDAMMRTHFKSSCVVS